MSSTMRSAAATGRSRGRRKPTMGDSCQRCSLCSRALSTDEQTARSERRHQNRASFSKFCLCVNVKWFVTPLLLPPSLLLTSYRSAACCVSRCMPPLLPPCRPFVTVPSSFALDPVVSSHSSSKQLCMMYITDFWIPLLHLYTSRLSRVVSSVSAITLDVADQ